MEVVREWPEGGSDLQLPEADPACSAYARFVKFVRMLGALLGRTLEQLNEASQWIGGLEAQVTEFQRTQLGRRSEVQPPPAEAPADGDTPEPHAAAKEGTASTTAVVCRIGPLRCCGFDSDYTVANR